MGRTMKPEIYEARRNEILDVAQQIVMGSKGFSEMAIQDILDELKISKGAFYHYFDSKHALLEALIERIMCEAEPILNSIVDDPSLSALSKLDRFFSAIARWKTARKDYLAALLRVWYADENALTREKLRAAMPQRFGPLLNASDREALPLIMEIVAAYNDALERILGAPAGSFVLVDPDILRAWFEPAAVPADPSPG
jgi:AcrR family transcriptional regulator